MPTELNKSDYMDSRAQVSLDYLITVTFAILLTIAVAALIIAVSGMAVDSQADLLEFRNVTIQSLMG